MVSSLLSPFSPPFPFPFCFPFPFPSLFLSYFKVLFGLEAYQFLAIDCSTETTENHMP